MSDLEVWLDILEFPGEVFKDGDECRWQVEGGFHICHDLICYVSWLEREGCRYLLRLWLNNDDWLCHGYVIVNEGAVFFISNVIIYYWFI